LANGGLDGRRANAVEVEHHPENRNGFLQPFLSRITIQVPAQEPGTNQGIPDFLSQQVCRLKVVPMKRAVVLFALLSLFTFPAFGRVPELNVTAVCKARSVDTKMLQSSSVQSIADCVRDEEAIKQQLSTLWESISVPTRNRCESDARALGTTSYLDLFACIQIAEDTKSSLKDETGKR
jgi:hypothetical protein